MTRTKSSGCFPCQGGKFSDEEGLEECKNCLPGKYSAKTGTVTESQCIGCAEGSEVVVTDDVDSFSVNNCTICPLKISQNIQTRYSLSIYWYSPTNKYALLLSDTEVVIPANHQMDFENGILKLSTNEAFYHMPRYYLPLLPALL